MPLTAQSFSPMQFFLSEAERSLQDSAGSSPSWRLHLRRDALARFHSLNLPGRTDEEWRFTPISSLLGAIPPIAELNSPSMAIEEIEPYLIPNFASTLLVFVNGMFHRELSTINPAEDGIFIGSIADALHCCPQLLAPHLGQHALSSKQPFCALNTAFLEDGAFIHVSPGKEPGIPIHVLYYTSGSFTTFPRLLAVAEKGSSLTVIESYGGREGTAYFTNAVTEIVAETDSQVVHYKVNRESSQANHIASTQFDLGRDARTTSHSISMGGKLTRNDIGALLNGEKGRCVLNGLYMGKDDQLVDNHTSIIHAMPHCESHELYKGILTDRAHGVFNGKIFVKQDAQKTDAKQTNQTLLLSREAQINTKPQLEIFADDVKCTHGATVGQLSDESLFYLRSRGIPIQEARMMLVRAFALDIIERIPLDSLREALDYQLLGTLPDPESKPG